MVSGQVRLKRLAAVDEAEFGLWVRRGVRRCGVGTAAVGLAVTQAASAGFRTVHAETIPANLGSQTVLARHGFALTRGGRRRGQAVLILEPIE